MGYHYVEQRLHALVLESRRAAHSTEKSVPAIVAYEGALSGDLRGRRSAPGVVVEFTAASTSFAIFLGLIG